MNTTDRKTLTDAGFMLEGMGGNCTAYVRDDGEVRETIGSADHEGHAPEHPTEQVYVWTESFDGPDAEAFNYTLADVLAALRNPSDEYHLLDLRLANGLNLKSGS